MSFPLRKPKTWPYAASSTGRLRGSLPLGMLGLRLQVYEATGQARRKYIDLSKDIVDYLDANASDTRASSCYVGLSLFMVGRAPEKTKPMVMIVSEDKNARVEAFRLVNKSRILAEYPGFEVGHMPLRAEFENLQPLRGAAGSRTQGAPSDFEDESEESDSEFEVFTPLTDLRTEGRRLRAWLDKGAGDGEMQSATAGGLIESNGEYYLHTVAHFLKPPTATTQAGISGSDDEWDATGLSDFEEDGDDDLMQATSRGSWTPDGNLSASEAGSEADILDFAPRSQASPSRAFTEPRNPPSSAGTLETLIKIGRVTLVSDSHDSAFIDLDANLPTQLRISRTRMRVDALRLETFAEFIEKRPTDTTVKTMTSHGNLSGTLSGSLSYLRLPHTTSFQKVYTGKLERPLVPGDSGSWVRNAATGKLLGHIIAGSPTTGLIIVMPAIDTFTHAKDALKRQHRTQPNENNSQEHLLLSNHVEIESEGLLRQNTSGRELGRGPSNHSYNIRASDGWRPGPRDSYRYTVDITEQQSTTTISERFSDFWWHFRIWARSVWSRLRKFVERILALLGYENGSGGLFGALWRLFSVAFVFVNWIVPKVKSWLAARTPRRINANRQPAYEADEAGRYELMGRSLGSSGSRGGGFRHI